jgi:hypothetical protein
MQPPGRRRKADAALAQLGVGPFDVLAVEDDVRVRKLALDLAPRLLGRTPAQDEHYRPVGRLDLDPTLAAEALAAEDREADHPGPELVRPLLVVDGTTTFLTPVITVLPPESAGRRRYAASSSGRPKCANSSGIRKAVTSTIAAPRNVSTSRVSGRYLVPSGVSL